MPLSKYLIRNEYGLADPELYRAADKDDPEALLEGVAMAGLVGLLRQLGDLAEFAAEIFHDLHEEVMATAARGHGLMSRVKQLEAEVPSLEKAFFSQTHHSSFFTNGGIDWHPNLRSEQNLVTRGNFPRLIMDSYEECRGPPRLFLLDKFDVAGAGACLKRYTDPSFFKVEPASSDRVTVDVHREKRIRKFKQKKGARLRDGEAPNIVPTHSKLHQLLLEERIENGYSNPARLVKLKKRQFNGPTVDAKAGKSYMEKFLETPSPDHKMICESSIFPLPVKPISDDTTEARIKILEISSFNPVKKSLRNENNCSSPNEQEKLELELKPFSEVVGQTNGDIVKVKEQIPAGVAADEMSYIHLKLPDEVKMAISERKKIEGSLDGYHSDDMTSEVDNYLDALTTMESELDTDNEYKPKKKFLNIQKIVDINDKEQQLQARLSDSQSFGDSSTSDDISSFKQDRNEEHIEVQAQSADSHSTGSSSISDNNGSFRRERDEHIELQAHFSDSRSIRNSFSSEENISFKKDRSYFPHFDSSSTVVENVQSEPMFTKTNNCEPEIDDTKSIQLPQIAEFQNTDSGIFVMHDNTHTLEEEISDSLRASSDLVTSGLVLSSDLGTASPVVLPQSDETPPDPVELNSRLENDADKNGLVESIASEPVSLSPIEDDAFPVDSPDKISSGKLDDDDDPVIHSDDSLQVSNDLALARGDEHCDDSVIKMFQAQSPEENSSKISVCRDIGSQGDDPICPSMEEFDMDSNITVALDCQGSKDEGCIMAHQADLEDLSPVVKVPQVSCFTREPFSDLTCNDPQDEPGSAKLEVSNSGLQSNFEEIPQMARSDEINGSTRNVDPVDGDGCFKCPSVDNHVIVNGVVTEIVQSEDQAVYSVPSDDSAENDPGIGACPASGMISSPSTSFSNSQEPVSGLSDSYQMEIESQTVEQISTDSNTEKRENQLAPYLDKTLSDIIYSPTTNHTKVEESISNFADPHKKEIDVNEAVARESLTELDGMKTVDHLEIASPDAPLNSNKLVPGDLSDSGICDDIQKSSPREKLQHSVFVDEAKMGPEFSGLDSHLPEPIFCGQNDLLLNGRDSVSSPSHNQLESLTELEPFAQSQVGEQNAKFLLRDEENSTSEKSQYQKMQILEQEDTHATSESVSEIHEDEPSSFYSIPDKATENNLDQMPPMPPLPPMQWRMGKFQHDSLNSQKELEPSQASVQPMQPIKPDTKSQFSLPSSESPLLYQTPFFPLMAVENDKLQHPSGFSVGVSGNPVAVPLQLPLMVNDAKGQYNYVVLDRNQIQNPFLTLPVVPTGIPSHGYTVASEGEMVHTSNLYSPILPAAYAVSGHDSTAPHEKPIQTPSQLMRETSSDDKTIQQSISNVVSRGSLQESHIVASYGEMVDNSNPCPPIPPAECSVSGYESISPQEKLTQSPSELMMDSSSDDKTVSQPISDVVSVDRPQHVVASEGEMIQNSKAYPPAPSAGCAVSGHDSISPQHELTQLPNQLVTETSSEVKTFRQSMSNVDGEEGHPCMSLMSPPNMGSMELNQSFPPFEGEMVSPLDTSDFDSERINGKPKNKLPRPRSPLIDAVAAHDKSKLRRATERVMPQIAPKLDERDSLLEQIRTKSFNLKPAVATRPSIHGPKTNLRVAAILEKANAIRQALAGSDEDDDDSWSDS